MRKLQKENKYDLCHCWFGWPSGFFGYLNRNKQPYLVSLRGSDVPGYNLRLKILDNIVFKRLSRKIWGNAKSVTVNSEGLKELAHETWKGKIEVIYNGVDTKQFERKRNKHKGIVLLCVARLIKRKGVDYLIRAMPQIISKNKEIRLLIVGEGPEKEKLLDIASSLNVKKHVEFIGKEDHDNMPKIYQNADIFILPSLNEGMSNTVLEAMASGLPIITTDTGGTKELVKGNGIVVRQKSSKEITEAVIQLSNAKKRKAYGIKSRQLAQKLSWSKVSEEYIELYKKASR
jgi:glycosyltransferase involved in cell wall biosynthesis